MAVQGGLSLGARFFVQYAHAVGWHNRQPVPRKETALEKIKQIPHLAVSQQIRPM
jgi:hypothetical protein